MNVTIANAVFGYFEALYDLNRNLIMCCGLDVINNSGQYEKPINEIIQNIPRLIPYAYNKSLQKYEIKKEGLLEFADDIPFLEDDYVEILCNNYDFLADIKKIRNKLEHNMHGSRLTGSGSCGGLGLFDLDYRVEEEKITLRGEQFVACIKQLNVSFSKIQKLVEEYAIKNGESHYAYYRRLLRYTFSDFNPIYESPLLKSMGQALFPF